MLLPLCTWAASALGDSLLWGPYAPQLYFGMRPQLPSSFVAGLMWYGSDELRNVVALRHSCNNEDEVVFGWDAFDPRIGGIQTIKDGRNGVNLTTELVKSEDGKAWEVRIRGEQAPNAVLTTVVYATLDSVEPPASRTSQDAFTLSANTRRAVAPEGVTAGDMIFSGQDSKLGKFRFVVTEGEGKIPKSTHPYTAEKHPGTHYSNLYIPGIASWQAREIYLTLVQDQAAKYLETYGEEPDVKAWNALALDNMERNGNVHFVQKTFEGPFEFRMRFGPKDLEEIDFDTAIAEILDQQKQKFEESIELQAPFTTPKYQQFARTMLSNVAGGIGYFYGDSLVATESGHETMQPHELFTSTPSRTFFPRGFYWDEGFNALALMDYDADLVLDIIASWLRTMDKDGYIQREQILGNEARSRVPEEFQVQNREIANPPTLVMALAHLGDHTTKYNEQLAEMYPLLQKHFDWFRRTQSGELVEFDRDYPTKEAYRWRGRTETHCLASGLDDYPRAPQVSSGDLHVDLLAWIGAMAHSLERIANRLGKSQDAKKYAQILRDVQQNLEAVHWDSDMQSFCDVSIDEYEEDFWVCHTGYVTMLPFLLKLVPASSTAQLTAALADLRNPKKLWSVGGVRSLSKSDPFYGTDENYWRGPVWNNMNFLALDALQHYAATAKSSEVRAKAAEIYRELRLNVVNNIYSQWEVTGYVWESYNAESGTGKGAKAFTGWGALVANIMAMPESVGAGSHDEL